MVLIRSFFIILALVSAFGCTAVSVRPVDTVLGIQHVCIEDGQQVCFDGEMMGVIRAGFERHGITTQIYTGNLPSECEYHLSYMCNQTWDMAMYMHHAELRLYRSQDQIGYAEYHLKGGGGFSPMKWESTKTKMDPVIDELLSSYPIVNSEISSEKTTETAVASLSSVKIDPIEPWSGVWVVEGSRHMNGVWGMKQSGKSVESTKDSLYKFEGKVSGNQLEGTVLGDYNIRRKFVLTMSSDGLRFDGSAGSYLLIGSRKSENTAPITPVKFNISEPWTGTWEVESTGKYGEGQWVLKQQGNTVKSAGDSSFDALRAEVKGNELKGRIHRGTLICPFKLKISADGQSFEGILAGWGNVIEGLKGKRKK